MPGLKNSTQGVTIPIGQQWIMGDISASVGHGQLHASYDKLTAWISSPSHGCAGCLESKLLHDSFKDKKDSVQFCPNYERF